MDKELKINPSLFDIYIYINLFNEKGNYCNF